MKGRAAGLPSLASGFGKSFSRGPASLSRSVLLALALVAAGADLIASDLPLAARVDGKLWLLPCLTRPAALLAADDESLAATVAQRGGWILRTPIAHGPLAVRHGSPLESPSLRHLAGTDEHGRDVAARLVHALRTAAELGLLAAALSLLAGLVVGLGCATSPALDLVLGRAIEVTLTFPSFFLLLALQGALGGWRAPSVAMVALAIAISRWPDVARLVRTEAARVLTLPHVEAARGLGVDRWALARRHVLPFASGPALTAAAFTCAQAILVETGLSFLGFGVPPPTPSFGEMLAEAEANGLPWWLLAGPSLLVTVLLLASQSVADAWKRRLETGD